MKKFSKGIALLLALVMALSLPLTALADASDANFTLISNITNYYAGLSYEIEAQITDMENATNYTAFTWTISSASNTASISSKNNYNAVKNDNGTYTVTETASFKMPETPESVTITAKLGNRTKSVILTAKQPIEKFDINFTNTDHSYFDAASETLYLDRRSAKASEDEYSNFSIDNILPSSNEDSMSIGSSFGSYTSLNEEGGIYTLTLANDTSIKKGTLTFAPESGRASQTYTIQPCAELKSYTLMHTPYGATKAQQLAKIDKEEGVSDIGLQGVAGKPFTISASSFSPSDSNDEIKYTLYTNAELTDLASSKYCTVNSNTATLNIDVAGTYYLAAKNYSADNGKLLRKLGNSVIKLVISEAVPIQTIKLCQLDENEEQTNDELSDITLFTAGSNTTYLLSRNVKTDPTLSKTTDSVSYSSSNTSIATVSSEGLITAKGKGTATIWVRSADNSNAVTSVNVNVKIGITSIDRIYTSDGAAEIASGHTAMFVADSKPVNNEEGLKWSCSRPEILDIDPNTGVATAAEVTEKTSAIVNVISESGKTQNTPIYIVPAVRADNIQLSVSNESEFEISDGTYKTYNTYYVTNQATKGKSFKLSAEMTSNSQDTPNDECIWSINYENEAGMSIDDAVASGYIKATKNSSTAYDIVPLKQGQYVITCQAAVNAARIKETDPYDRIIINLKQTATTMSVINEATQTTSSTSINLPIGSEVVLTVKTSTPDNNKTADPPVYEIAQGGEYISVTEKDSEDGEGKTYTIKGLSYSYTAARIVFSSKSKSKTQTITFNVKNNLNNAEVTGYDKEVEYTRSKITLDYNTLKLYIDGSSLDKSQYSRSFTYVNNQDAGTATVTINGADTYAGSFKIITFKINQKSLEADDISVADIRDQWLSKTVRRATPSVTVKHGTATMKQDTDYKLSYINNTSAGTATAIITGIGNYKGEIRKTFKVCDVADYFSVAGIAQQTYRGSAITPSPVVKYYGRTLKKGTDYTLTYANNISTGIATVYIKGIGSFSGTISRTFYIKPRTGALSSLKAGKKSFTVKWKIRNEATGYQIQYSTNSKFKSGNKTSSVSSYTTTSKQIKKLKAKKKYYVRIRAYKTVNGKKVYGAWSAAKSVKTKK